MCSRSIQNFSWQDAHKSPCSNVEEIEDQQNDVDHNTDEIETGTEAETTLAEARFTAIPEKMEFCLIQRREKAEKRPGRRICCIVDMYDTIFL